jgi:hypothetical protein
LYPPKKRHDIRQTFMINRVIPTCSLLIDNKRKYCNLIMFVSLFVCPTSSHVDVSKRSLGQELPDLYPAQPEFSSCARLAPRGMKKVKINLQGTIAIVSTKIYCAVT